MLIGLVMAATLARADQLQCVSSNDRIEITLPADMDKRIASMAVVAGKRWLTLVDEQHHLVPFKPGVRRLTLTPSDQMAAYHDAQGKERRVRAFAKHGAYRIVFSDNLETEPENMTLRDCVVHVK